MKLRVLIVSAFLVCSAGVVAQTSLPYFTGWDNTSQQTGWQTFRKGSTAASNWQIATVTPYSAPNNLIHYYPVGGSSPTRDWYVSPPFNFAGGGMIDSVRHNFSGFGTPMAGDSVAIWLLTGSPDPALATSKILLHDFVPGYVANSTWEKDSAITIPATAGTSYIAFQYETTVNWLDVRFDNLAISGSGSNVNEISFIPDLTFYPNPASTYITLERSENTSRELQFTLYNTSGASVYTGKINAGERSALIPVHELPNGIYYVRVANSAGLYSKKLVVAHE